MEPSAGDDSLDPLQTVIAAICCRAVFPKVADQVAPQKTRRHQGKMRIAPRMRYTSAVLCHLA